MKDRVRRDAIVKIAVIFALLIVLLLAILVATGMLD